MNTLMTTAALKAIANGLSFASRLPAMRRIRRRGFSPRVKRGDVVSLAGRPWVVARRSNWSLWLYEHQELRMGDVIRVRLPRRYADA